MPMPLNDDQLCPFLAPDLGHERAGACLREHCGLWVLDTPASRCSLSTIPLLRMEAHRIAESLAKIANDFRLRPIIS